jgi:GntR family transcriptional regulator, transcriptional repressor for pyruvate dehydrogenase complex
VESLKFDKIDSVSVVNNVVNQISALILERRFVSGEQIPTEVELGMQLGVSRNSIREAIKILNAVGILEVRRGKGTFVASTVTPTFFDPLIFSLILEPKSNKDLYELRMMFDSMVLFCAIERISQTQIQELEMIVENTREMYTNGRYLDDVEYYMSQDVHFHKCLLETTGNPLIQRIGHSILEFIPEYVKKSIQQDHGILRSINNHKEIISILKSRDRSKIIDITDLTLEEWKNNWQM